VEDGVEAIDKVQSLDPDLVILDITMPRKDEVAAELTRMRSRCKILVLTMHGPEAVVEQIGSPERPGT
jgi:DNA-binding NarL/FixJ family response regulator